MGSTTPLTETQTLPIITNLTTASIPSAESATPVSTLGYGNSADTETPLLSAMPIEATTTSKLEDTTRIKQETEATLSSKPTTSHHILFDTTPSMGTSTSQIVELKEPTTLPSGATATSRETTPATEEPVGITQKHEPQLTTATPKYYLSTTEQFTEEEKIVSVTPSVEISTLQVIEMKGSTNLFTSGTTATFQESTSVPEEHVGTAPTKYPTTTKHYLSTTELLTEEEKTVSIIPSAETSSSQTMETKGSTTLLPGGTIVPSHEITSVTTEHDQITLKEEPQLKTGFTKYPTTPKHYLSTTEQFTEKEKTVTVIPSVVTSISRAVETKGSTTLFTSASTATPRETASVIEEYVGTVPTRYSTTPKHHLSSTEPYTEEEKTVSVIPSVETSSSQAIDIKGSTTLPAGGTVVPSQEITSTTKEHVEITQKEEPQLMTAPTKYPTTPKHYLSTAEQFTEKKKTVTIIPSVETSTSQAIETKESTTLFTSGTTSIPQETTLVIEEHVGTAPTKYPTTPKYHVSTAELLTEEQTTVTVIPSVETITSQGVGMKGSTTMFNSGTTATSQETISVTEEHVETVPTKYIPIKQTTTPKNDLSTAELFTDKEKSMPTEFISTQPFSRVPPTMKPNIVVEVTTEGQMIKENTQSSFSTATIKGREGTAETFKPEKSSSTARIFPYETRIPTIVEMKESSTAYFTTEAFVESSTTVKAVTLPESEETRVTAGTKSTVITTTENIYEGMHTELPTVKPLSFGTSTEQKTEEFEKSTMPPTVPTIYHPSMDKRPVDDALEQVQGIETTTKVLVGQTRESRITSISAATSVLTTKKYETTPSILSTVEKQETKPTIEKATQMFTVLPISVTSSSEGKTPVIEVSTSLPHAATEQVAVKGTSQGTGFSIVQELPSATVEATTSKELETGITPEFETTTSKTTSVQITTMKKLEATEAAQPATTTTPSESYSTEIYKKPSTIYPETLGTNQEVSGEPEVLETTKIALTVGITEQTTLREVFSEKTSLGAAVSEITEPTIISEVTPITEIEGKSIETTQMKTTTEGKAYTEQESGATNETLTESSTILHLPSKQETTSSSPITRPMFEHTTVGERKTLTTKTTESESLYITTSVATPTASTLQENIPQNETLTTVFETVIPTLPYATTQKEGQIAGITVEGPTTLSTYSGMSIQTENIEKSTPEVHSTVPVTYVTTEKHLRNVTEKPLSLTTAGKISETTQSTKQFEITSEKSTIPPEITEKILSTVAPGKTAAKEATTIPVVPYSYSTEQAVKETKLPSGEVTTEKSYESTINKETSAQAEKIVTYPVTLSIPSLSTEREESGGTPQEEISSHPQSTLRYPTLFTDSSVLSSKMSEAPTPPSGATSTYREITETTESYSTMRFNATTRKYATKMISPEETLSTLPTPTTLEAFSVHYFASTEERIETTSAGFELTSRGESTAETESSPKETETTTPSVLTPATIQRSHTNISTETKPTTQVFELTTQTGSPEITIAPEIITVENLAEFLQNQTKLLCKTDEDCSLSEVCWKDQCLNPCVIGGTCAPNANCSVFNHVTECACPLGYLGDPKKGCILKGISCTVRL